MFAIALLLTVVYRVCRCLDGKINKWYAEQVNKIAGEENQDTRLETNVDNSIEEDTEEKINFRKIIDN